MTVTLTNTTRRMKVYNLPHEVYCKALGKCACTVIAGRNERRICSSLTIPANDKLEGVDDAALSVPEISADVRSGHIAVDRSESKTSSAKGKTQNRRPSLRDATKGRLAPQESGSELKATMKNGSELDDSKRNASEQKGSAVMRKPKAVSNGAEQNSTAEVTNE